MQLKRWSDFHHLSLDKSDGSYTTVQKHQLERACFLKKVSTRHYLVRAVEIKYCFYSGSGGTTGKLQYCKLTTKVKYYTTVHSSPLICLVPRVLIFSTTSFMFMPLTSGQDAQVVLTTTSVDKLNDTLSINISLDVKDENLQHEDEKEEGQPSSSQQLGDVPTASVTTLRSVSPRGAKINKAFANTVYEISVIS